MPHQVPHSANFRVAPGSCYKRVNFLNRNGKAKVKKSHKSVHLLRGGVRKRGEEKYLKKLMLLIKSELVEKWFKAGEAVRDIRWETKI